MMKLLALHKRNSHKSHEVAETSVELDEVLHEIVYEKFLGDLPDLGSRRDQRIQGFKILDGHLNLARSMSG